MQSLCEWDCFPYFQYVNVKPEAFFITRIGSTVLNKSCIDYHTHFRVWEFILKEMRLWSVSESQACVLHAHLPKCMQRWACFHGDLWKFFSIITSRDMNKYAKKNNPTATANLNKPILTLHLHYSQGTNTKILKLGKTVKWDSLTWQFCHFKLLCCLWLGCTCSPSTC